MVDGTVGENLADPGTDIAAADAARHLIAQLLEREAQVVACIDVVGLDVARTSVALGMSSTAVRVAHHRGLGRLRKILVRRDENLLPTMQRLALVAACRGRRTWSRPSGSESGVIPREGIMKKLVASPAGRLAALVVVAPLDLDLLGSMCLWTGVVLDIVAASGAGNLLGNLLCAVTALLDGGLDGSLDRLVNLLNRILRVLRFG